MTEAAWLGALMPFIQIAVIAILSILGYLLKRQVDQNDTKIDLLREDLGQRLDGLEARSHEADLARQAGDYQAREVMIREFQPRSTCDEIEGRRREDIGRLFEKIESVGKDVAALKALMEKAGREG